MKARRKIVMGILGLSLASCLTHAQNVIDWKGTTGDFFDPNNWTGGVVPGVGDVAQINNGGTATVGVSAGTFALAGIRLGSVRDGTESGHVIMNGGTLNLSANAGDPKAVIGASATLSSFILNGGTIFFDGPDAFPGSSSEDGVNGLDWEVGELGKGRFEMHGGSFFGSDDLKIAENAAGIGYGIIDGNSHFAVGSGISVGGGGLGVQEELVIAGNALVEAGNSLGAGDANGMSDEGYLTMSSGGSDSKLTIKENGVLNIRRLTSREGKSYIEVMDHGQFHIFDVLHGTGKPPAGGGAPNRPEETGPNSTYASAPSDATLILRDDSVMTVNSTQGLGISAPRDAGNAGGTARMTVRDRANFRVEQALKVGTGAAASSIGSLEVVGGSAKVSVGGNLLLAWDDAAAAATPGSGTLSVVLTGSTQTPVEVTGTAFLANGTLKIATDSFSPALNSTFRILKAGAIDGTFKAVDISGADLATGLTFAITYNADSVDIKVVSGAGRPEDSGITSKTGTIYVNPPSLLNNDSTESIGVAIGSNGNVLVGWEDDGDELADTEAAWMLYSPTGTLLNQAADITTLNPIAPGATFNSTYRSFFRANGDPTPHYTAWGPKIKANLFGPGLGMGATAFDLGIEVPEMEPVNNGADGSNSGDFPAVQLINDSGAPVKIVSWSDADTEPSGDIRIGDWDYLANGNVLIVGEDRQAEEQTRLGAPTDRQPVFKIVTQANVEVKGLTLASSSTDAAQNAMWHGSAVTANGFAIRAALSLRFFSNDGTPLGPNVDVGALTGDAVYSGGTDRGESVPFHGNGKDTYVLAAPGVDKNGVRGIFVTAFNADGTLRWATNATAGITLNTSGRVDTAVDQQGRVVVVYDDTATLLDGTKKTVQAIILDNTGKAINGPFLVSGTETGGSSARVAWRGDEIAVAWVSQNAFTGQRDPAPNPEVVALRLFTVPSAATDISATITRSGNNITIAWTGGTGPWVIQKKIALSDTTWMNVASTAQRSVTLPVGGDTGFFRVAEGVATTGITTLSSSLSGANERPTPVTTAASGFGIVAVEGNTLNFDITFKDLSSNAKLMHIHGYGTVNEAKGVIIDLMPFLQGPLAKSGRIKGSVTLDATQKAGILGGQTYVNVHSDTNGGGEIRGQIVP